MWVKPSPSWSPITATSPRTRRRWWMSITSRCPPSSDCRDALAPDAPRVHRRSPHNLLAEFSMGFGDVDGAFAGAAHVFRESLWQHRGGSHSIECRGAVAVYDKTEDRLTLWSSTQMPHAAQRLLCDMLGRDENQVRVVTPDVGGGFGPKLVFYPEDVDNSGGRAARRPPGEMDRGPPRAFRRFDAGARPVSGMWRSRLTVRRTSSACAAR